MRRSAILAGAPCCCEIEPHHGLRYADLGVSGNASSCKVGMSVDFCFPVASLRPGSISYQVVAVIVSAKRGAYAMDAHCAYGRSLVDVLAVTAFGRRCAPGQCQEQICEVPRCAPSRQAMSPTHGKSCVRKEVMRSQ